MCDIEYSISLILVAVGAYSAGMLVQSGRVLFWKIEWIIVEHKLALVELREPREVSDILDNA